MARKNENFKNLQKQEAIERIKVLKLHGNVLKDFKEDVVNRSEFSGFPGILFWLDDEEKKFIEQWQKDSGNLAYHVIKTNTEFGLMYSVLYVSKYEKEWEIDRDDLLNGTAVAYCRIGLDEIYGEHGDYGTIGVSPANGGLTRTF